MTWRQWSISVLWFTAVLSVVGQSSPVTNCTSTYNWSINSLQQTPCLVAAYLESACGNITDIPALPLGDHYLGPGEGETNSCLCSSVTYSMISACAGCQSRNFIDWPTWSQDCLVVFATVFPESIPPNVVEVPSWAYLNLSLTNNDFSLAAAEQNASETVATSSTTSSAISTSTSVSNSLTSSTASAGVTSASPTSAGKSKSNAGAIAGGVVGGLGFLAVVAIGTLWLRLRRKRNMVQQNVAFDSRALVSGKGISQPGSIQEVSPFLSQHSQSIYTSDMSLYPGSPLTTTGGLTTLVPSHGRRSLESLSLSVAQFGGGLQTYGNVPHGNVPHGYSGMPEI